MSLQLFKTAGIAIASSLDLVTTVTSRTASIADHSLGAIDEYAAQAHGAATASRISSAAKLRTEFMDENPDLEAVPPALQALLDLEL